MEPWGGGFTGKAGGALSGFFFVRKTKEKRKEKGTREKEKQKKNRENEIGGGEQARVPNLSQLNLQGPGASAAPLVTTHYGLRKSGFKNTPGNRPLLRSENFY